MTLRRRIDRLEGAKPLVSHIDNADRIAGFWARIDSIEANLLANGDDLQFNPRSSCATNFTRALMRGEVESAKAILSEAVKR